MYLATSRKTIPTKAATLLAPNQLFYTRQMYDFCCLHRYFKMLFCPSIGWCGCWCFKITNNETWNQKLSLFNSIKLLQKQSIKWKFIRLISIAGQYLNHSNFLCLPTPPQIFVYKDNTFHHSNKLSYLCIKHSHLCCEFIVFCKEL